MTHSVSEKRSKVKVYFLQTIVLRNDIEDSNFCFFNLTVTENKNFVLGIYGG